MRYAVLALRLPKAPPTWRLLWPKHLKAAQVIGCDLDECAAFKVDAFVAEFFIAFELFLVPTIPVE